MEKVNKGDIQLKKNYLKHFIIIGGGTIISMFISLLTTPIITRIVDPKDYGQYSIFTLYSNIVVMILCMGLDQALVRFYFEKDERSYKTKLLKECIKYPIIITIVFSSIVICAARIGCFLTEFDDLIVVILCFFTLIQLVYRFSQLIIRLEYKSKLYSILNIINKMVYVGIIIIATSVIKGHYLLIMTISITVATLLCVIISIIKQKDIWINNKSCDVIINKVNLIKYGAPYIISMGITMIFQASDQLALNFFCDYTQVGIYASAMTLVHIFAVIQTTFNTLWTPMAVEHYSDNGSDKMFYQKGNQVITIIMFSLGVLLIMSKDVFAILLGEKYREAAYILPFLVFNPIMYTISETTVSGLVFKKKSNMQMLIALGACFTNIIGNTVLVPRFECIGAAISTGLSYIVFFALRTHFSNKYFYVDFKLKKFYFLTIIMVLYAFYNTFFKFNFGTVIMGILCLLVIVILYFDTVRWMIKYGIKWIHIYTLKWRSNK